MNFPPSSASARFLMDVQIPRVSRFRRAALLSVGVKKGGPRL